MFRVKSYRLYSWAMQVIFISDVGPDVSSKTKAVEYYCLVNRILLHLAATRKVGS